MTTQAVQRPISATPAAEVPPTAPAGATDSPTLLPVPAADAQLDQLSALFALQSRSRTAGREANLADVERVRAERERLQAELRRAQREVAEAQRKHRKWGKVGKLLGKVARAAGVVGSIALAVATAGAAAPLAAVAIAGAILSTAGYAVGELGAFDRFPNADKWALGLSLAGAGLSSGAGIAAGVGHAARAVDGFERGVMVAGRFSQGAEGVAGAGAGVSAIGQANTARDAREHQADADAAALDAEHQRWLLEQIIEMLESLEESETEASETLSSAIQTKTDTIFNQAAGAPWRG